MKTNKLTKGLAIAGTILILLPVVLPLVFGLMHLAGSGEFLFDWLMPAELLPVVLLGAALLIWAALRAKVCRRWIILSIGIGLLMLVIGLTYAQTSGLAQSPEGTMPRQESVVTALVLLFDLGVLLTGVGGVLLLKKLFLLPPGSRRMP